MNEKDAQISISLIRWEIEKTDVAKKELMVAYASSSGDSHGDDTGSSPVRSTDNKNKDVYMNPTNGRKSASTATEIVNYVIEAQRNAAELPMQRDAGVNYKQVAFAATVGEVVVRLVAQSPFQNSHYQISHPVRGKWMGYLNGVSIKNGEFGVNPGKPKRLP